jgi:adenosine deaminase
MVTSSEIYPTESGSVGVIDPAAHERVVEALPKAETHIHLEGSIRPETVFDLAAKNDVELPADSVPELLALYDFESLDDFIDKFSFIPRILRTAEDVERVTAELGADSARQNVPYREVAYGYAGYEELGVDWETVEAGIAAGRERAMEEHGVDLRFIPSIDRTADPETGVSVVERAADLGEDAGIVGVGLASKEQGYPAHDHARAFRRADELGLDLVAHAGEDAGPGSVWDALLALDVDRIDHGVRAAEDEILVEYLAEQGVPLATCPVSNVELNVYDELPDHPVVDLHERGVFVTINSDDPPMFHADLTDNYVRVAETFDLAFDDLVALAKNSFEATFLDDDRTAAYLDRVDETAERLRTDLDVR